MNEKGSISRYCVYTMRHTRELENVYREGGSGTFTENKRWVQGERLFRRAAIDEKRMPVVFTAAEKDGGLIYYAFLCAVEVDYDAPRTTYSFSGLTPFSGERPKNSLTKKSDNKPLSGDYIRPYAICLTPGL